MSSTPIETRVPNENALAGAVATVLRKSRPASAVSEAILAMQRRGEVHGRQEADARRSLVETADTIVSAIRAMTQAEQEQTWMKAIGDGLIADRRELRNGVAALVAIALQRTNLSASFRSQMRTVIQSAIEAGVTVASLAGQGSVSAAYRAIRAPGLERLPSSAHCHLRLDSGEAARAAVDGRLFRIEGGPTEGFRLVACDPVVNRSVARPLIDGAAEEVPQVAEEPSYGERPWFCIRAFTVRGVSTKPDAKKLLETSAEFVVATDPSTKSSIRVWRLTRDTPEVRAIIEAHDPQPWPRTEGA
ncbi:hypothetical protein [Roseomonas chloroacetimidivorans]|uniref:hypothetical protein n=1 Tax=Roseomonas chloroacetimidivorans TaxID=1766656 RepID=UPI003C7444B4